MAAELGVWRGGFPTGQLSELMPSLDESLDAELVKAFRARARFGLCRLAGCCNGERVDRALAELVPEFSRSYLQQLGQGLVALNGKPISKPRVRLVKAGDVVALEMRPTLQESSVPTRADSRRW